VKAGFLGLAAALVSGAGAHALSLPMGCESWTSLGRVLVEVQTVKFQPYVLAGGEDRRSMSCRSADVTGRIVEGLSKGARKSGPIRFSATQSSCAGLDDRPDDPMPKKGDQLVLAWDLPDPEAGDYWVSERRTFLADQKECAPSSGPRPPGRR
jgi:hypothetical protein